MGKIEDHAATAPDASSSWASMPVRDLSGKTLGDFEVERQLGKGGMGEVYLARQISLDRPVALKVLRPDLAQNPTYMARFEAEAWAAAKINHPNIIHIYAIGTFEGTRYIAMEYVQGTNLREYIVKRGIPDLPLSMAIMRQSGLAVGAAGEAGLIHRDIKPENLMLTKKGQIKVADFGLCRLPEAERMHLTQTGMTLGTPVYMSPEQVQGHDLDHRSDLYSLGVTFFHMLSGAPPFRGETAVALALKHVREQPPSLAVSRPDLPAELVALVMKLMAKKPGDRYASAADMLRDLAKIKEALHFQANPGAVTLAEPMAVTTASWKNASSSSSEISQEGTEREWPWRSLLYGLGAACLLIGGGLGWMSRTPDLLSPGAVSPATLPAIWLAPWETIARQPSAMAQYRYALTRAGSLDSESAWLAVPGYYPNDHEASYLAYLQLGRLYLKREDRERLGVLSTELKETENRNEAKRDRWVFLANVLHACEMAVLGEGTEAVFTLNKSGVRFENLEPPLAELTLEAVIKALRKAEGQTGDTKGLKQLRDQLSTSVGVNASTK